MPAPRWATSLPTYSLALAGFPTSSVPSDPAHEQLNGCSPLSDELAGFMRADLLLTIADGELSVLAVQPRAIGRLADLSAPGAGIGSSRPQLPQKTR